MKVWLFNTNHPSFILHPFDFLLALPASYLLFAVLGFSLIKPRR